MNEIILCERIATLRRDAGFTQEQLAARLGVSYQAVSKWENAQSCPDIMLLPALADIFGVSIDSLFGRGRAAPEEAALPVPAEDAPLRTFDLLPWDDDGAFYCVVFRGHELLWDAPVDARDPRPRIEFGWDGPVQDLNCAFSVDCDAVGGNVTADGDVKCDGVLGHVSAGGDVSCDDVAGNVSAGGDVDCGDVAGSVNAGGDVDCGDVLGSVSAGGDADCGDVGGFGELGQKIKSMVDGIIEKTASACDGGKNREK